MSALARHGSGAALTCGVVLLLLCPVLVLAACGGSGATTSASSSASPAAGPSSWEAVNALTMDPGRPLVLYAGTRAGVFETTDGATTWTRLPTPGGERYTVYLDPDEMADMIERGVPVRELREAARARGVETVREDGVRKVLDGDTSISELARVVAL